MATPNSLSLHGSICFSLLLTVVGSCPAYEGLLEKTCDLVYQKLASGPYESLTNSFEGFLDEGRSYHGCAVRLSGNPNKITASQDPEGLFGQPLLYCPNGKLPADSPREPINKNGWCGDRNADGPDGTSYRALKDNVFCLVRGSWDGGDDSDPGYVPSPRSQIIVQCANQ